MAEERLAEVLTAYRALKTENEGYRDRITRNLERRFDQRRERLLLRFIEILDNLDRALEAAEISYAGNPLIEGLILVRTQLLQTLKEEGLERIPVVGHPYDPSHSEAVETRPVDDPEQHHVVVRDLQRGYRLHGKVARAAKVAVGEYHPAAEEALPEAEELLPGGDAEADGRASAAAQPPAGATEEEVTLSGLNLDEAAQGADPGGDPPEQDASLEDIIKRAEQEQALFPAAFEPGPKTDKKDDEQ